MHRERWRLWKRVHLSFARSFLQPDVAQTLHLITETACLVSRNFLHEQCHAAAYSKVDAAHTEFEKVGETDVGFGMCVLDKPALKRHVLQCGIENDKQVQKE